MLPGCNAPFSATIELLGVNPYVLLAAGKQVGATAEFTVRHDPLPRELPVYPRLAQALAENEDARAVFTAPL
ncbi:MAG: hypothetical protein M3Y54_18990 [Bacteroidota bacterium]|nr:hypothetical protein [Bacteroidota bacterium]